MAMDTTKVILPRSVATYIKDNTKGFSTVAALSPAVPIPPAPRAIPTLTTS